MPGPYQPQQPEPWEQDYEVPWQEYAQQRPRIMPIDRMMASAPEPMDHWASQGQGPAPNYGMGMLPSPGTVGGWLGDAAQAFGGGGLGNYGPSSRGQAPSAGAGSWRSPEVSPMGAPNAGPPALPAQIEHAADPANAALAAALAPPDNSIEAIRKRLGFSWGGSADSLGENGRPAIDSEINDPYTGETAMDRSSTGGPVVDGEVKPAGFSQTSMESIPWGQRPASWQREQFEQIRHGLGLAGLQKAQQEAKDPFQLGAYQQKRAIDSAQHLQEQQAVMQQDTQQYDSLRQKLDSRLQQIEHVAAPPAEKTRLQGLAQDEFNDSWAAYQQARLAARQGAIPSAVYAPR